MTIYLDDDGIAHELRDGSRYKSWCGWNRYVRMKIEHANGTTCDVCILEKQAYRTAQPEPDTGGV